MCLYYGGSGKTVVSDLVYFKSFGKKKNDNKSARSVIIINAV